MSKDDKRKAVKGRGRGKGQGKGKDGAPPPRLAGWKRAALVISIIATLAGGAGYAYAVMSADPEPARSGGGMDPALAAGLLPGAEPETTDATGEPSALRNWSPVVFRLGFSFFVGFCIAYALRSVLRIALVLAGLILLAIVALQSTGIIDVNWSSMEGPYDAFVGWLGEQTAGLQAFVTGYLPSSASGLTGLVVGFRRR